MGKGNLAIVGTHRDYFADEFDNQTGTDPSHVAHCASPEDAARAYLRSMFENSCGIIRSAIIAVWPVEEGREAQRVFAARAILTPCTEPDAEEGEMDVLLDVTPWP